MKEIDLLKKIEKVATPPSLLTRIEAQLNQGVELLSRNWLVFSYGCIAALLIVNISLFSGQFSTPYSPTETVNLVDEMNLSPSNQLYND